MLNFLEAIGVAAAILGGMTIILLVPIYAFKHVSRIVGKQFVLMSEHLGLKAQIPRSIFFRRFPTLTGEVEGRKFGLEMYRNEGAASDKPPRTRFDLECKVPQDIFIVLGKRGFFKGVKAKWTPMEEVEFMTSEFNKHFIIKSKHPEFVRAALYDVMRNRFEILLPDIHGTFTLQKGILTYDDPFPIRTDDIRLRFELLIELARQFVECLESAAKDQKMEV